MATGKACPVPVRSACPVRPSVLGAPCNVGRLTFQNHVLVKKKHPCSLSFSAAAAAAAAAVHLIDWRPSFLKSRQRLRFCAHLSLLFVTNTTVSGDIFSPRAMANAAISSLLFSPHLFTRIDFCAPFCPHLFAHKFLLAPPSLPHSHVRPHQMQSRAEAEQSRAGLVADLMDGRTRTDLF